MTIAIGKTHPVIPHSASRNRQNALANHLQAQAKPVP